MHLTTLDQILFYRAQLILVCKLDGKKTPKLKKNLEKFIPLNKVGKPEDISNASIFLLSDQAGYITGTELIVDGGITSKP